MVFTCVLDFATVVEGVITAVPGFDVGTVVDAFVEIFAFKRD